MSDLDIDSRKPGAPDNSAAEPVTGRRPRQASAAKTVNLAKKGEETVAIVIPKTKDAFRDVFVSVNGDPFLIKRGVRAEVPVRVMHALEIAVEERFEKDVDETGREVLVPVEAMSYPFHMAR